MGLSYLVTRDRRAALALDDDAGRGRGVYLFRVETDAGELVRKAVVLR